MDQGGGVPDRRTSCCGFCSAGKEEANKRGKWRERAGRPSEMSEKGGECAGEEGVTGRGVGEAGQEGQRRCHGVRDSWGKGRGSLRVSNSAIQ